MATKAVIKSFEVVEGDNVSQRWLRWVERFKLYVEVMKITDEKDKINHLLLYGEDDVFDAYQPLKDVSDNITAVINKLNGHFNPASNTQISVFQFRACKQFQDEKFDEYVSRLREMAKTCAFGTALDTEMKTQIIQGSNSENFQTKAMETTTSSLADIVKLGRTVEAVSKQLQEMKRNSGAQSCVYNQTEERVHQLRFKKHDNSAKNNYRENKPRTCFNCGEEYPHEKGKECPARGKECHLCQKRNHLAKCCRSRFNSNYTSSYTSSNSQQEKARDENINKIELIKEFLTKYEEETVTSDNVWAIRKEHDKTPRVDLNVNNSKISFAIDTGASVNIMDEATFNTMRDKPVLRKSSVRLLAYGSTVPIEIIGEFKSRILFNHLYTAVVFQVVAGAPGSVLGNESLCKLGIVKYVNSIEKTINSENSFIDGLKKQYPSLFTGKVGKLKDFKVTLHVDPNVKPIRQRRRPVSLHLREKVKNAIQKMLGNDVIEAVNGPTPWVSPIVPVIKENGTVRVCTDARLLNTAITREVHTSPTIDELAVELNEAKIISKFDFESGYHQLELDEKSRDITVFITDDGLYRYKRLNFGITSASEIFQKTIEQVLEGLPNCKNISDDIIVWGRNREEHDKCLHLVLQRLEESGLTVNIKKCSFGQTSMDFFGLNFSADGIKLKQSKIDALLNAKSPQNQKELKSLNGLVNYCAKFIPDLATLLTPLRSLMKRNTRWVWEDEHETAFNNIKRMLTTEAMAYFNKEWRSELTTDASPTGLSAVLSQIDPQNTKVKKIVLYASRGLSDVEKRYSQVEKPLQLFGRARNLNFI